ncbi:MAG TPA: hypothetical protein VFQ53_30550 [Kofleriaceae bacterium]|nr:hypothetical protein [Kofleriaceae bacterium]
MRRALLPLLLAIAALVAACERIVELQPDGGSVLPDAFVPDATLDGGPPPDAFVEDGGSPPDVAPDA